jgi:hypothetical protein
MVPALEEKIKEQFVLSIPILFAVCPTVYCISSFTQGIVFSSDISIAVNSIASKFCVMMDKI